jgi:putative NIF3 family GTP cyclohydrolase 1 type 2
MLQMVAPRRRRADVIAAVRAAHPYEEPAFDVIELADVPSGRGGGRIGDLAEPITLADFADVVAATLPTTAQGVRAAGDPRTVIRRVAICGGSGDSMLGAANAAKADVYLTSDLRHHRASEHLEAGGCALVDVAHWAAEWMWLPQAARLLEQDAAAAGYSVGTTVSTTVTDPWTFHVGRPTDAR